MKNPWTAAVVGAVVGIVAWWALWALYGVALRTGELGDLGVGIWVIFTQKGKALWIPYLLAALSCGGLAFAFVRSRNQ